MVVLLMSKCLKIKVEPEIEDVADVEEMIENVVVIEKSDVLVSFQNAVQNIQKVSRLNQDAKTPFHQDQDDPEENKPCC